jgi:tetratricopeptide (TPR) repeat protein
MKESALLVGEGEGRFRLAGKPSALPMPATVAELLGARLARLGDEDRELLEVAACAGNRFDPGLVATALGSSPIPVLRRLASIERGHRVVRAAGRKFVFDHDLIRQSLYEGMPEMLREEYHATLGEALSARSDADPAELCRHLLLGRRERQAAASLPKALERLDARHRNEAAVELAGMALDVEGLIAGKERLDVLVKHAERLGTLGRREEQLAVLDEAIGITDETGEMRSVVRHHRGRALIEVSRHDEAAELLEAAVRIAREEGDRRVEGGVHGSLGHVDLHRGDYEAARASFERHRDCAREAGDRQGEGAACGNLGLLALDLGRLDEAIRRQEESERIASEIDDRHGLACALGNMGLALHQKGRHAEAEERFAGANRIFRKLGNRQGEGVMTGNLGLVASEMGRTGEALTLYERQLLIARETGYREGAGIAHYNLASIDLGLGRVERCREHYAASLRIAEEIDGDLLAGVAIVGLGDADWLAGFDDEAEREYREGLSRLTNHPQYRPGALNALGRFLAEHDRGAEAAAYLDDALAMATEQGQADAEVLAAARRATLDGGDVEGAVARFDREKENLSHGVAIEAGWLLFRATGERRFVALANDRLDEYVGSAPEEFREDMIANVPIHRRVRRDGSEG